VTVPIRLEFFGVKVQTEICLETANKIACGLAGTAAGLAVIALGAAAGNINVMRLGTGITAASALGAATAAGLGKTAVQSQVRAAG
jgi:hypothetical protein